MRDSCGRICLFASKRKSQEGFTLLELAQFMIDLGCVEAINLDGGKSSSLTIKGEEKTKGDKRSVSDCLLFERRTS
ncbi:MAG: phosphodiester glycosidase family protein [Holosporales bacterium]|nr:phosphodiester glycosidase family protein [Holosporales bacterium]